MQAIARLAAGLALPAAALGQGQPLRLIPNDFWHPQQLFGSALALHGDYALVGAPLDPIQGEHSGALYVFDRETGAQVAKLYAPDGGTGQLFGSAIACWGDHVLVGRPYDDQKGPFTGSAYLLEVPSGKMLAKFTGSSGKFGSFGEAIVVSGDLAFIGAHRDSATGYETGAVFVFDLATKELVKKLVASDGNNDDRFGWSIAVGEGKVVVGAPEKGVEKARGRVYVFDRGTLQELYSLDPGSAKDWYFGHSVAVAQGRVLVGAPKAWWEPSGGTVFVYDAETGAPVHALRPQPSGTSQGSDSFGFAIRSLGKLALIGAPFQDGVAERSGVLFIFHVPSGLQLARYALPCTSSAQGAATIDTLNGWALVGAPFDSTFVELSGAAWLVDLRETGTASY